MLKTKTITIDERDSSLLRYAVAQQRKDAVFTLELLKLTKERDLTKTERLQLPSTLRFESHEDLRDQINPWVSLVDNCDYWLRELELE